MTVVHGGAPAGWLDFSASLNPCGTPPEVAAAIAGADYSRYSGLDATAAESHLARDAGVAQSSVLLTAGATEALRLVTSTLSPGDLVGIAGPTYREYRRLALLAGACVRELGQELGADAPVNARAVFVCQPNNPTAVRTGDAVLGDLAERLARGAMLVIDESFAPFMSAAYTPPARDNVVRVRSLTKRLAIPGIRTGYIIASAERAAELRARKDPWSVGAHACAAAAVAHWTLTAEEHDRIALWKAELVAGLEAAGLHVMPSDANFLFVHAGPHAGHLVAALAARRIAVRHCTSFGLPEHLRIAVRPSGEQRLLLAALAELGT